MMERLLGGAAMLSGAASLGLYLQLGPRHRLMVYAAASHAVLLGAFSLYSLHEKFLIADKASEATEEVTAELAVPRRMLNWTFPRQKCFVGGISNPCVSGAQVVLDSP